MRCPVIRGVACFIIRFVIVALLTPLPLLTSSRLSSNAPPMLPSFLHSSTPSPRP
ncbi:hypothetical protein BDQ12DRAFT_685245 [Crucibulum laeve]|uniref:Uncharacterized protein n=1 Tax=Crucibulum laeve TaxID=68775 RepID=A0A5C3LZ40_9AGAR|nr:hypothetical protein BDQ12DRAFT_685245 [Crucibulum laeve]